MVSLRKILQPGVSASIMESHPWTDGATLVPWRLYSFQILQDLGFRVLGTPACRHFWGAWHVPLK